MLQLLICWCKSRILTSFLITQEILESRYTGNDEIILKELENTSNIEALAEGGVASVLPKGTRSMDYRGGGVIPNRL